MRATEYQCMTCGRVYGCEVRTDVIPVRERVACCQQCDPLDIEIWTELLDELEREACAQRELREYGI